MSGSEVEDGAPVAPRGESSTPSRREKRERLIATAVESGLLTPEEADRFADSLETLTVQVQIAGDQAQAMSNAELGELLLNGRWTTIEIHEAGRRLRDL